MKTLLHICCANCAVYPIDTLKKRGIDAAGFWYNPNIHPLTEYALRLEAVRQLAAHHPIDIHYDNYYGLAEFIEIAGLKGKDRCEACYRMRLEETAKKAKALGYDTFSTTLLYSVYQKHELIVETAADIAERHSVEFYSEDFRGGWREGIEMSRKLSLYRQKYCGCIYSEMERYAGKMQKQIEGLRIK
ncbi:MAG: epoxyqueuosine reductase QueH [Candidatus Magnetominusculus sp. LBB02]|nr:epoxyqueuosine reductase QueH [Candidatus Magnetominusculus sp. LBB02]